MTAAAIAAGLLVAAAVALALIGKWQLGVRRSAGGLLAAAAVAALAVAALDRGVALPPAVAAVLAGGLTLALCGAIVLWRFYRDPERTPPPGDDLVVSPADGVVVYVRESAGGELPVADKRGRRYVLDELVRSPLRTGDAIVVGIALSFLDVHVNRSPIAGAVTGQRRHPGRFASLKDPSAVFENERATTVVERAGLQVAVVLIASRLVRRIVSYVREGEAVASGQRIGVIRFGSQVDVVLPRERVRVLVAPGERVRAAETILAEVVPVSGGSDRAPRAHASATTGSAGSGAAV